MFAIDPTKNYCSPYGWNMSLPYGWRVLPRDPSELSSSTESIEVFVHPQDPSLSMTWTRSPRDIGKRLWQQFCLTTLQMGAASTTEVQELMTYIFRLIGSVETAVVITLPDGQRALEITEQIKSFGNVGECMQGYHLICPVRRASQSAPLYMQQLSFYARSSKFKQEIASVMKSARSFQYL